MLASWIALPRMRRDSAVKASANGSIGENGVAMTREVSALVFDAYGTIFDVHSVAALAESFFPGKGAALSAAWRAKQLEYTWQRSLMGRYEDFSRGSRWRSFPTAIRTCSMPWSTTTGCASASAAGC